MKAKTAATVAMTLVLVGGGASTGVAGADPAAPPPEPKTTIDHDGRYSVGTDIEAGTYASAGPVESGTCYWKRLGGPEGGDIIDNAMTKKPQLVRIEPGDKAFKTDGCQPWQKTDSEAGGAAVGGVPPLAAGAQLHDYLDALNGAAGQVGGGQLPHP